MTSKNIKTKEPTPREIRQTVLASSLGTAFEWYDFFIYGSLAVIISQKFFLLVNETAAFIFALAVFAAGFAIRPLGALVFGRLGDLVGRKYTFMITVILMGGSTFAIGLLPTYETIGLWAPVILVCLRLMQGLAIGGEYGGAAIYVAEHASKKNRGYLTSWIQTTGAVALLLSICVILTTRITLGEEAFLEWGWRIPFLFSIILLAISVYIRLKLNESPVFKQMQSEGKISKNPLKESFGNYKNLKIVLISLFGLIAGQAVVWYTGFFYTLFFLTYTLKIDGTTANIIIAVSLIIATPFFILFGWLSDKIGRKKIIMVGCLLAALTYFPIFKGITHFANPALEAAARNAPVVVVADPATCSFQFNPVGTSTFLSSCDIAKSFLAKNSVTYSNETAPAGFTAEVKIGDVTVKSFEGVGLSKEDLGTQTTVFNTKMKQAITTAGYPEKADKSKINYPMVLLLISILMVYATMVYGPLAALLVEMFPPRIRYSSISLPYHIGNGWFGGFLPTVAFAMVAAKGDIYYGLWYPIAIALMTFVIGILFIRGTKDLPLDRDE